MRRALLSIAFTLAALPAWAQSTINPALPQAGLAYSSSVIRGQFDAAYYDINALYAISGLGGPCGALGGDLTGTCVAANVAKIQGTTVSGTTGSGAAVLGTGPSLSAPTINGGTVAGSAISGGTISTSATGGSTTALIANRFGHLPLNVVDDFGASCSGGDDTAALQAAAAASGTGSVGLISIPVGKTCNFSSPIQFANSSGPGFLCFTPGYCTLNWTGAATDTPILFASNTGPFGAAEIVRTNGGAGYAANDTVTLNDGCGTNAIVTIRTVSAGVPTTAQITTMGSCTSKPGFSVAQLASSGGGTGVSFDMFYGSLGSKIFYPTLQGVVLTSSTTMTENAFVRADFTGNATFRNLRIFGADKIYQGISVPRGLTNDFFDTSIEHTIAESVLLSGVIDVANGNVDTHFRNVYMIGCNSAVGSKAVAIKTGCLRVGDGVGGLFFSDKVEVYQHKGYAVYFAATAASSVGLNALAYLNNLNVESSGAYAGAIGGVRWASLAIGGAGSWLTGMNIDTLDFSSADMTDIRLNSQVFSSQTDASNPASLNFNSTQINIYGSEIGGYTSGTTAIKLGTSAAAVFIGNTTIENATVGMFGTTATGGIKTMSNVNFLNNTTDLSGIACGDFKFTSGSKSTGVLLCPNSKLLTFTRDLTAASGNQALTGFGFTPSRCTSHGAIDASVGVYTTLNGKSDATGASSALFYVTAGQVFQAASTFLYAGSGADNQQAAVASYDADGLTLSWVKGGTPSGTFKFTVMCERD